MAPHEPMGQGDRGGKKGVGLARRVPEHHPLVACPQVLVAGLVHAHRDVRGLLAEGDEHRARLAVEAVAGIVVPDRAHPIAHQPLVFDMGVRPDLPRQHHHAGLDQGLAGDPASPIPCERGVDHRVRDLVGDLVGVSLGDGLRGEDLGAGHRGLRARAVSGKRRSYALSSPRSYRAGGRRQGLFALRNRFARANPVRSNRSGAWHGHPGNGASSRRGCPARGWDGKTVTERYGRDARPKDAPFPGRAMGIDVRPRAGQRETTPGPPVRRRTVRLSFPVKPESKPKSRPRPEPESEPEPKPETKRTRP